MNHIRHSPSEQENKDNSMEGEEGKDIERLDTNVGENGTSSVDPHVAPEYSAIQKRTSVRTGQKGKSSFSSSIPSKISLDNWNVKQKDEHPSVNEASQYNDREVASRFSIAPPISQMMMVDSLDNSQQAVKDNTSTELANDETDYSKGDISTDSIPEIGAVSYPNRAILSFLDHDVAKGKITQHLDTEGLPLDLEESSPETEDPSAKTKGSPPDTERTSSDTERTSPDTEVPPSQIESLPPDREGSSTNTEDPLNKTKGSLSGIKRSLPDAEGSSPDTDRALSEESRLLGRTLSDAEGSSPEIEGSSPDTEDPLSQIESLPPDREGSSTDTEDPSFKTKGSSSDTEGSFTDREGSFTDREGSFTDREGSFTDTEGSFTDTEGSFSHREGSITDRELSFTDTEGSFTDTEGSFTLREDPTLNREIISSSLYCIPPGFVDLSYQSLEILRKHLISHNIHRLDAVYEYFEYILHENELSCKICEMYAFKLSPPISPLEPPSPPY